MKIMQVNKFWRVHGGSERYVFELSRLLEERGHEIIPFAMQDRDNQPSRYSSLFVSPVELSDPQRTPVWKRVGIAARILHSKEARDRISVLADLTSPDVAHLHNIYHQLSPSILAPLRERGIGSVMTIHDYKLFCPALRLFNEQGVCERCRPFHYAPCVKGRCVKDSLTASMLCAGEMFMHDLLKAYSGKIDVFIAPSQFVADKLYGRGIASDRVAVIPNVVDPERWSPGRQNGDGSYALFCGRLSREKGIITMVKALAGLPEVPLKVAGAGLAEGQARALARELGAANIQFIGFKEEEEVKRLVRGSRFVLVPSEWYENAPMSVLEAFACGKPVVAARIGGIPEMVREGSTGMLAQPGDEADLRRVVEALWNQPELAREMGGQSRQLAETEYTPGVHYDRIISAYERVRRT